MSAYPLTSPASSAPMTAEPRFATPRNPARQTCGGKVAKIMRAIGQEPLPWQRDALAVACEIDPATGQFWYNTVIVVVLRRAGKTTISRAKLTHRALTTSSALMVYSAQDRKMARRRLNQDIYRPLAASPLGVTLTRPNWRPGEETVHWTTGAELGISAISRKSGHGDTLHEAHVDEAFAHVDSTYEDGVQPGLMTVPGSQLWVLSAAGDERSTYLRKKVDLGRAIVESGLDSRTCYIEYSAPEDADPNDPATLAAAHPAVGHQINLDRTMSLRVGADEEALTGWNRAWLGWWPRKRISTSVIPVAALEKNFVSPEVDAWTGTPVWTIDVSPEREYASIGMGAEPLDPARRAYVELWERQLGTSAVVSTLRALRREHGGNVVVVDAGGPARSLIPDLKAERFRVETMSATRVIDACGSFYDDALVGRLALVSDEVVNDALEAAVKKHVGKSFRWARGTGDITPLYALTLARQAVVDGHATNYAVADSLH